MKTSFLRKDTDIRGKMRIFARDYDTRREDTA